LVRGADAAIDGATEVDPAEDGPAILVGERRDLDGLAVGTF